MVFMVLLVFSILTSLFLVLINLLIQPIPKILPLIPRTPQIFHINLHRPNQLTPLFFFFLTTPKLQRFQIRTLTQLGRRLKIFIFESTLHQLYFSRYLFKIYFFFCRNDLPPRRTRSRRKRIFRTNRLLLISSLQ